VGIITDYHKPLCHGPFHDRDTSHYVLGRRLWSTAVGAPCSSPLGYRSDTRDTRCGIGPTTFPRQKVSTMARGAAETTHTVRRAQGKSRAGDGTPGKLHRPALHTTRRRQYVVFFIA